MLTGAATELPDLLRRGKPEASDGEGEAGPLWRQEQGPLMRGREQAARMPAHTPLRGSDTEDFSKGSDTPRTFHLCLVLLHVLMRGFIAMTHRLKHWPIHLALRENQ